MYQWILYILLAFNCPKVGVYGSMLPEMRDFLAGGGGGAYVTSHAFRLVIEMYKLHYLGDIMDFYVFVGLEIYTYILVIYKVSSMIVDKFARNWSGLDKVFLYFIIITISLLLSLYDVYVSIKYIKKIKL